MSMAFSPIKDNNGIYEPGVSYYDAGNSALKYAITDGQTWYTTTVASTGKQGLYSNLFYNDAGTATIMYFDKTHNRSLRATGIFRKWSISNMNAGGREMKLARRTDGEIAFSGLDEAIPELTVHYYKS